MNSPSNIFLVEEADNPSSAYFVSPRCGASGVPVHRVGFTSLPASADGALVVFVRYVPKTWRIWVEAHRRDLSGVVLFMDDDLLDPRSAVGTPWRYRWKLWRLTSSQTLWLRRQGASLWVSTPYLYRKYSDWPVRLLLPTDVDSQTHSDIRIFYHGTASHRAETFWLETVMRQVMDRNPAIRFEVVGDARVRRKWRTLPGVAVVHPMKWPAYRSFSELQGRHIGLAPLLDLPFNRGRSYTKFFDITRSGAVGVYSDHPVFRGVIEHDRDGLIVANRPEEWVDAITRLAGDEVLRARLLEGAREQVRVLSERARENNAGLL